MKRKFLTILLTGCLVLSLCACQGEQKVSEDVIQQENTTSEPAASTEAGTEGDTSSVAAQDTKEQDPSLSKEVTNILYYDQMDGVLLLNDKQEVVEQVSLAKLLETADEELREELAYANIAGGYGDKLFLHVSQYYPDEGNSFDLYVVNVRTGEITLFGTFKQYLDSVDFYEDNLYITVTDYSVKDTVSLSEYKFVPDEKEKCGYRQVDNPVQSILDDTEVGYYLECQQGNGIFQRGSMTRQLGENGYLVLCLDGRYDLVMKDGSSRVIPNLEGYVTMLAAVDRWLLYSSYSEEDYNSVVLYAVDVYTGDMQVVIDSFDYFIGCNNGTAYFAVDYDGLYRTEVNHVFAYTPQSNNVQEIYTAENNDGFQYKTPGLAGFQIIGDSVVCLNEDANGWFWQQVTPSLKGPDIRRLGKVVQPHPYSDYGFIEARPMTWVCPNCGKTVANYFSQMFQVSMNAKGCLRLTKERETSINDFLLSLEDADFDSFVMGDLEYLLESCEEHEWEYFSPSFVEWEVANVGMISNNLLAVDYTGYWYGGGAHGYPYRSQYVFDLTTGLRVCFEDVYPGTEEEFKTTVAMATVADWKSYDYEDSPYFAQESSDVYAEAYEMVSMYDFCQEMTKNGIIYYYSPYAMGPYASGYIEIFIPYDELGIKLP